MLDGYTHVVYNFIRSGDTVLQAHDECTFKGFDLPKLWLETESRRMAKLNSAS